MRLEHGVSDRPDLGGDGVRVDVGVELVGDELTRRQQGVRVVDRLGDVGRGDPACLRLHGIDDHIDLALPAPVDRSAGDPRDPLQDRLDVVERVVVELGPRQAPAGDRHLNDRRVGRIVLQDEGGQNAQRFRDGRHRERDLLLHQGLRGVEVRPPLQPYVDDAEIVAGHALDVLHAGGGAHVLLDAPGQRLLDVLGTEPRRHRPHDQDRRRQLGEGVDAHPGRHHDGEHDQRDRHHQNGDRVAQRHTRHACASVNSAGPSSSAGRARRAKNMNMTGTRNSERMVDEVRPPTTASASG